IPVRGLRPAVRVRPRDLLHHVRDLRAGGFRLHRPPRPAGRGHRRRHQHRPARGRRGGAALYRLPHRSVTQPTISLKGFERFTLAPGERKTVSFTLEDRHLAIWNRDMLEVVEPGPVVVSVGSSSAVLKQAEFTIA